MIYVQFSAVKTSRNTDIYLDANTGLDHHLPHDHIRSDFIQLTF